jgi:hypothetical protein
MEAKSSEYGLASTPAADAAARGGGRYFASPTRDTLVSQQVAVAVAVLFLSVAGDAHGSATPVRLRVRCAAACANHRTRLQSDNAHLRGFDLSHPHGAVSSCLPARPQSRREDVARKWLADCSVSGVSGTTVNFALGITALALFAVTALSGLGVVAATVRAPRANPPRARTRVWVFHPPACPARGVRAETALTRGPGSAQGRRALHHWRCGVLLSLALPAAAAAAALYVWALARWAPGMRACADCHDQYAAWLASPRTNEVGRACPQPAVLTDVPAGVQSVAGALVRSRSRCVLCSYVEVTSAHSFAPRVFAPFCVRAGLHLPVPALQDGRGGAAAGAPCARSACAAQQQLPAATRVHKQR